MGDQEYKKTMAKALRDAIFINEQLSQKINVVYAENEKMRDEIRDKDKDIKNIKEGSKCIFVPHSERRRKLVQTYLYGLIFHCMFYLFIRSDSQDF